MRVLLVGEKHEPKVISIPHKLEVFQELVGGTIEIVEPFDDDVVLICNENARCDGKPVNRIINKHMDVCGDFFICGSSEADLTDLAEDKIFKYSSLFRLPKENLEEKHVYDQAWYQILS